MADPASHFAPDYPEARARFIALSERAGAELDALPLAAKGPDGGALSIDVAWVGPKQPRRALLISSGIHGVEGFYGSAVQHQLLTDGLPKLPDDTALVLIHALNAYGFAHVRRVNESNVDLNRNFIAHPGGHLDAPDYDEIADLLNPTDMDEANEQERLTKLFGLVETWGFAKLQQVITGGQYAHPQGMQFGGQKEEQGNTHVRALCKQRLAGAEEVTWIDLHTGLGESGTIQAIFACQPDDPQMMRGKAIWGERAASMQVPGQSVSADLHGALSFGVEEALGADTKLTLALAEAGTVEPVRVFLAMRADNWLAHHGQLDSDQGRAIKAELREVFCPADAAWQQKALGEGAEVIARAVAALRG